MHTCVWAWRRQWLPSIFVVPMLESEGGCLVVDDILILVVGGQGLWFHRALHNQLSYFCMCEGGLGGAEI